MMMMHRASRCVAALLCMSRASCLQQELSYLGHSSAGPGPSARDSPISEFHATLIAANSAAHHLSVKENDVHIAANVTGHAALHCLESARLMPRRLLACRREPK